MTTLVGQSQISFQYFLTTEQQQTFSSLIDQELQSFVATHLLSATDVETMELARLTLDILQVCTSIENRITLHRFLLAFLKGDCQNKSGLLKNVLDICKKGGGETFFKYASTAKRGYYSSQELAEITRSFYQNAAGIESIPHISNLLSFEEGGKTQLHLLKQLLPEEVRPQEPVTSRKFEELLKGHFTFSQFASKVLQNLFGIPEKNRLDTKIYSQFFSLLQRSALGDRDKMEIGRLALVATVDPAKPLLFKPSFTDLETFLSKALEVHQLIGEEALFLLRASPDLQTFVHLDKITHLLHLLQLLAAEASLFPHLLGELQKFSRGTISLDTLLNGLEESIPPERLPSIDLSSDISVLVDRFTGRISDTNVQFPLDLHHVETISGWYQQVQRYCSQWQKCRMAELVDLATPLRREKASDDESLLKLVAIGRLAIRLKFHLYLHNTQILALLALFVVKQNATGQMKPGEGKSMINILSAFILLMQGKKGAAVTSAKGLSTRDQRASISFFKTFGIITNHICDHQPGPERFQADLIYGITSDFEFALMREMLYNTPLFQGTFDFVLIDEADFLTIDTALNSARLSYPIESSNDWVYPPILHFIRDYYSKRLPEAPLPESAIHDVKQFLMQINNGQFRSSASKLTDEDLRKWLGSAKRALFDLHEGQDYTIGEIEEPDETRKKGILIVDAESSGRIFHGSRWGRGLHEFLEAKHGIAVEKESLCPISVSHSVFYNRFALKIGFTGTLGAAAEREGIAELYQFKMFDIPTHLPSKRVDLPTRIFRTTAERRDFSIQRALEMKRTGRPMLFICETIQETLTIAQLLTARGISFELLNEIQSKSEEEIVSQAGYEQSLTVATLNAGRGTDIKLKGKSNRNGGLFVHCTFHPESLRGEVQIRTRAARQGENGSSEIVLSLEQLEMLDADISTQQAQERLVALLEARREEKARVMKTLYSCRVDIERFAFGYTELFFSRLNKFIKTVSHEDFLHQKAINLGSRKLYRPLPDITDLAPKDKQLAKQAHSLLTFPSDTSVQWKTLLKAVVKRIHEKIITNWSLYFSHQVEELLEQSNMTRFAHLDNHLRQARDNSDNLFDQLVAGLLQDRVAQESKNELELMKQTITQLYERQKVHWENSLSLDAPIAYIREVTGASLEYI